MKKFILSSAVALSLVAPMSSFAAFATSTDNGDPNKAVQAWGLTGYQTPKVACYSGWFTKGQVCQDISKTAYYLARLNPVGIKFLAAVGFSFN